MSVKQDIKIIASKTPILRDLSYGSSVYGYYRRSGYSENRLKFIADHLKEFKIERKRDNKAQQIASLVSKIGVYPTDNNTFFYSIDVFKSLELTGHILDNYTVDYSCVVNSSFREFLNPNFCDEGESGQLSIVAHSLKTYCERLKTNEMVCNKYLNNIEEIMSLFERPAMSFHEGLQRILFVNQFLWQTRHKHNGLGHLDLILNDLYEKDLENGVITEHAAKEILKDFMLALHENMWFKSSSLLGDTGQIIILGGEDENGIYRYNSLTYLFIEVSEELGVPDPKVLLRCSHKIPEDLLKKAMKCISTGIGAPFLSNDDAVIPSLLSCGYDKASAYNYVTAACWEPLVLQSCDQNNMATLNFALPLVEMFDSGDWNISKTYCELVDCYKSYLSSYIRKFLGLLSNVNFESDPMVSMLCASSIQADKDITEGGAKYSNIGVTSVGLGSVVNSLLFIKAHVFDKKDYALSDLNDRRIKNYDTCESLLDEMKFSHPRFGADDDAVVSLTNDLTAFSEIEFAKYRTELGGIFKFGLSAPGYISDAKNTPATFDGRKNGDPFSTHISADRPLPVTELLSFASKLDYSGLKCNGNVVDFIVSPELLKNNIDKYCLLVKSAFAQGVYQIQMNVVSSKTLIAAREHPERFPDLIVRVWGFSAYFKDLPDEYKDVLIQRAIESEKAA